MKQENKKKGREERRGGGRDREGERKNERGRKGGGKKEGGEAGGRKEGEIMVRIKCQNVSFPPQDPSYLNH